jgi:copper chaperone
MEFEVEGMTCAHCKRAVENAIAELPGVSEVQVDLKAGKVFLRGQVSEGALIRALQNEGYDARLVQPANQSA